MATMELGGVSIELDGDGFMVDHTQWTAEIARALAKEEGIELLSERHFDVLNYMRSEFEATGTGPSIRKLKNSGGVPTKELYGLFPGGPAKKAARIAGIPKPHGCI